MWWQLMKSRGLPPGERNTSDTPAPPEQDHDLQRAMGKDVETMRNRLAVARLALLLATVVVALAAPGIAEARITRIEITRIESPTFDGASFGTVGRYERLVGRGIRRRRRSARAPALGERRIEIVAIDERKWNR